MHSGVSEPDGDDHLARGDTAVGEEGLGTTTITPQITARTTATAPRITATIRAARPNDTC